MMRIHFLATLITLWLAWPFAVCADFQGAQHTLRYEQEPIAYGQTSASNQITRLQSRLTNGAQRLKHDDSFGYLPALLDALEISPSSQMLVFARTSLHRDLIAPGRPRAVFFNDEVYVAWVRWAPVLEISVADPKLGGVFYVLSQKETENPRLKRDDSCLECHVSTKTLGVPGHLFRSFKTDSRGIPHDLTSGKLINHNLPLAERWGGWYVTGTHGRRPHLGNLFGEKAFARAEEEPNFRGNMIELKKFFNPVKLPQPTSDIVALTVFGHQVHMHNFITRLSYEASIHLSQYQHINYLDKPIEYFLRYLLFVDEAPILSQMTGTSGFAQWFERQGPRDGKGRSLRDLDLRTRLFKHPCSFLIYSPAFDQMPAPLKTRIYRKLWAVLVGRDESPVFAGLDPERRRAILEILVETKAGLPDFFTLNEP